MSQKKKVVVCAFTCRPDFGSEYEVGWRWSQAAAECSESLTITRRSCFDAIPGETMEHPVFGRLKRHGRGFYKAVDFPYVHKFLKTRRFMRVHYILWLILITAWIGRHRDSFHLAHHVCFVSMWLPPLLFLTGLPYVWGPVGTSSPLPPWARTSVSAKLWNAVTQRLPRFNPLVACAVRRARVVVAINENVAELLGHRLGDNIVIHPSIGQDACASEVRRSRSDREVVICSTRLVPIKLPGVCFEACSILASRNPSVIVKLFGEGTVEAFESAHPNLLIHGVVDQAQFLRELENARLLLFPTLEGSGFVALEALARGLPVVCLEESGPAGFIGGDQAGVAVPVGFNEQETSMRLVVACERMLSNESEWLAASSAAAERSARYTWSSLTRILGDIYNT